LQRLIGDFGILDRVVYFQGEFERDSEPDVTFICELFYRFINLVEVLSKYDNDDINYRLFILSRIILEIGINYINNVFHLYNLFM
jgi:hypothetical protein